MGYTDIHEAVLKRNFASLRHHIQQTPLLINTQTDSGVSDPLKERKKKEKKERENERKKKKIQRKLRVNNSFNVTSTNQMVSTKDKKRMKY